MLSFHKLLLLGAFAALAACSEVPNESDAEIDSSQTTLIDLFDNQNHSSYQPLTFSTHNANLKVQGKGKNRSLLVGFDANESKASFKIKPSEPWDWSEHDDINFAVDIINNDPRSISLFFHLKDTQGWRHLRSASIPPKSKTTFYAQIGGNELAFDSGIRQAPQPWQTKDSPMYWMAGTKQIDLSEVQELRFFVDPFSGLSPEKELRFENFRIRQNPKSNSKYLRNIIDGYGQRVSHSYPGKISNDEELRSLALAELKQLENEGEMPGRSAYGGWLEGPRLSATGFFRAEKYNGRWALVDPEGYLFFSSALANIRTENTETLTGIDFSADQAASTTEQTASEERNSDSRFVASETRNAMFSTLPNYDHPLAKHYSYRTEVSAGPIDQGETYSFYRANLERRYGESATSEFMQSWQLTTVKRMKNWGFTSFGNWVDPGFYSKNQIPFFASGWVIGDFKTVSHGIAMWDAMPDSFDPEFKRQAELTVKKIASEVKNSPWCIGVFIDNERKWGKKYKDKYRHAIALTTLKRSDDESPTKTAFTQLLKNKYSDIQALNLSWGSKFKSWKEIESGFEIKKITDQNREDFEMLSYNYAKQYFKVIHDALESELPNHLYLGAPMAQWDFTPEVIKAASEYVDVLSFNYYREGLHDGFFSFLNKLDKPSLISQFHIGSTDNNGALHPGLVQASSQKERARMYQLYMRSVIDNPNMVGAHWFQYIDSPITGRASDGENYATGFVNVADIPYTEMVNAAKEINQELYERRFTK